MFKSLITAAVFAAAAFTANAASAEFKPTAFTVQVTGQGEPMILIPGLASSAEVWNGTVAHYSAHYQCHVLNLAGFAGVAPISGPLLPQVEEQLSRYIAENHLKHPVLVGHSLGGYMVLKMAEDHPDQVGKIIVVDGLPALGAMQNPAATPEQLRTQADAMAQQMNGQDSQSFAENQRRSVQMMVTSQADFERVYDWGKASDINTVKAAMHDLMADDLRPKLGTIQAPVLAMGTWIAYKAFATREQVQSNYMVQFAKLPHLTFALSDNARHFIMLDDPSWMFAQIDAFLK
jgi:pimeloyl-ACP methyl ester carboxylesterase